MDEMVNIHARNLPLQPDQLEEIRDNKAGLTREGCEKKLELWKQSRNKYQIQFYDQMLKRCKNFKTSGKTVDGRVIYSRDENGKVNWAGPKPAQET